MGTDLWPVYCYWARRTNVTFLFRGLEWTVEALHENRRCCFRIGWDHFAATNGLSINNQLLFIYMGDYIFHVVLLVSRR